MTAYNRDHDIENEWTGRLQTHSLEEYEKEFIKEVSTRNVWIFSSMWFGIDLWGG